MRPAHLPAEADLRHLPPLRGITLDGIPRGWLELVYDFALKLALLDKTTDSKTEVTALRQENLRLTAEVHTTAPPAISDKIATFAEELENASRVTCSLCGKGGAKIRRLGKSDSRAILCAGCR